MTPHATRASRRTAAGPALGLALALGAGLAAPAATAAPSRATAPDAAPCAVSSAELSWGVKESFRSYISGSIANGEWTTAGGASYETPNFLWHGDAGEVSTELDAGTIPFTGSVHFTGHDGALAMDLANPTIEFAANGAAYLLLDFGATDTAQEGDPAMSQIRAAKIDLSAALATEGDTLTVADAPARLTSEGAAAFNGDYGSYAAGDEMDPITLTAAVSGCELGAAAPRVSEPAGADGEPEPAAEPAAPAAQEIPWAPIVIGGIALLVIGVTGGMLIAGRKRT